MQLPCQHVRNGENARLSMATYRFPSCGSFWQSAYLSVSGCRIIEATRVRSVLDPSIVQLSLAVFRRGNLAAALPAFRSSAPIAV